MTRIRITAGDVTATGSLNTTATAKKIIAALPINGDALTWGDEIYFEIPVIAAAENGQATVPSGTLAYWPEGHAFCIFFGQKPYSAVNVVGTLDGDAAVFKKVTAGTRVRIEKIV
jgi:hypothetical protein